MSLKFVGLHAHSLSVGDSIGYPEDHFNFVLENGGDGLAITDHGQATSYGYIFQAKAGLKKKGINFKTILGCELYIHPDLDDWKRLKLEKEQEKEEEQDIVVEVESESKDKSKWMDPIRRRHHLVVNCINFEGFQNLNRIITHSYRHGFYRFPRVDFKTLAKYNKGLVISTACLAGLPSWLSLRDGNFDAYDAELKPLLEIFGKERAYLELQFNKLPEQKIVNEHLIEYSKRSGYNLIATADSHYARPNWWREREIYKMLARQTKGYNVSPDDLPKSIDELKCVLYPKNGDQMWESYKETMPDLDENIIKEAIERTYKIAHEQIEDISPNPSLKLPIKRLDGEDPYSKLDDICRDALKEKNLDGVYLARLNEELRVIKKKNLALYFLTLKEAIDECSQSVLFGPGRGSGAGSLVNYLLGITLIDPIKHGLLFERFISENRQEMADIDSDAEDRDEVIRVLKEVFGDDNIVSITNFNTLKLKSLLKDICKLYSIPFDEINMVTSVMEDEARQDILDSIGNDQKLYEFTLEGALEFSPTLRAFLEKYPNVSDSVKVLFKQIKSYGTHAGGICITENGESHMPIMRIRGTDQTPWTEGMTAKHLEQFGIIKYDFLGLATLRIIRKCIEQVLRTQGVKPTFANVKQFYNKHLHPDVVGAGDKEVFEAIYHKGKFCSIFQFTESGAQEFCKLAKPETVNDIACITSLFRPGPLKSQADKQYVKVVEGIEPYYEHPILKEVLGDTKGQLVYQEQFMILANKLAGFSLLEADELRKLLVKPITTLGDEIKKKREDAGVRFIDGCIENGMSRGGAEELWHEKIMGYISYGFAKAHAVSYAYNSYHCAWLFHHYPEQWIASVLENDPDKEVAIENVVALGYKIGKLDILKSTNSWKIEGNTCIPSLSSVKGFGDAAINELIYERKIILEELLSKDSVQPIDFFNHFFFVNEVKTLQNGKVKEKRKWRWSKFNKRPLEALIKLEALEGMGIVGKDCIFKNYAHLHRALIDNWAQRDKQTFNIEEIAKQTDSTPWSKNEIMSFQQELLGTFDKTLLVGQEILDTLRECDILPLMDLAPEPKNLWFILKNVAVAKTKNNKNYYKLTIMDLMGKEVFMNYFFNPPRDGWGVNSIYIGSLYKNGSFINLQRGTFLERLT